MIEQKTWQQEFNDRRLASGGWYGCIVDDGWKDIVLKCDEQLAFMDPNYKINQVKEKFGGLRFYFETEKTGIEQEIMWAIASYAERQSYSTCELCGKYGQLRDERRYIRTLCDSCEDDVAAEYARRRKEFEEKRAEL